MKKISIGAVVGGLIIFIWQTLSWTALDLHRPSQNYTSKQDTVLSFLNTQINEEGGYILPAFPKGTSMEEMQKAEPRMTGKPWAIIQFHHAYNFNMNSMYMSMLRNLLVNIVMVWLLCWMLAKMGPAGFTTFFLSSLFVGLIVFMNAPYTQHIWYKTFDLKAYIIDAVVAWGACGLWLGWWMNRRK